VTIVTLLVKIFFSYLTFIDFSLGSTVSLGLCCAMGFETGI